MKAINIFNISRLRTEEDFGYLQQIKAETTYLPKEEAEDDRPVIESENAEIPSVQSTEGATPALTAAVNAFEAALDDFDTALKESSVLSYSVIASDKDTLRDKSWRGSNNYIKAMTEHPAEATRTAAIEIRKIYEKYGDPTSLAQTEESGVLHNLIQDLQALDSSKRTAVYFDPWLDGLVESAKNYTDAVQQRTIEASERIVGIVQQSRVVADEAYRSLIEMVNALCLVNGETPYITFIDHVNILIDRQKTVLKTRSTNAKKKKNDEPIM